MNREQKENIVAELSEKLQNNAFFYFIDASGMSVEDTNNFRRSCFKSSVEYRVAKNTLIRKALESLEADYASLHESVLTGFSGILMCNEAGSTPAKLLKSYLEDNPTLEKPILKAASIDGEVYIGEEHLETLSKIKSKEDIIGEVITLLQSPMRNVVGAVTSPASKIAGVLKTIAERA